MRPSWQHVKFVVLGTVWLAGPQAQAQITPAGPEIPVTAPGPASAYQGAPAVAWEPAGNYVLAWQQQSTSTGGWDVYAEQFGANGTALAPAFLVSGPSSGFCRQSPAVATDAAGDFVVVWSSNEQPGGTTGVYAQLYNSGGQALGSALHVNTTTVGNAQAPAVAMTPGGRFLVAWASDSADGSSWGIVARAYNNDQTAASGEVLVNVTTAGAQHSPAVALLPPSAAATSRYEIVWESEGQDGTGAGASGIVGRAFDGAGNPLGGELAINAPGTGAHAHPRLASDPSGNFTVTWENLTAAGSVVLARRFNGAGVALGNQAAVDASPAGAEHDPVVAADATGQVVVVWDAGGTGANGLSLFGQALDSNGQALGGKVQLNTTTSGDQAFAGAGLAAGGNLLVAWQALTAAADAATITARVAALPALSFYTVTPCRLLDTRNPNGPLGGPALGGGQVRNFPLQSASCQVPATAKALSINATVVGPSADGTLIVYPGDAAPPGTSNLNFVAGEVRANNAVLGLSRNGDGSVNVLPILPANAQVHFILDVNGYFQ